MVETEKIDHLIHSAAWNNELPSLASLSVQSANAVKYGVNILTANLRDFKRGLFGSGIINGKNKI